MWFYAQLAQKNFEWYLIQAMLDLTVNRMLLNPDTEAKIFDLISKNEDVRLELIFKLGLGSIFYKLDWLDESYLSENSCIL